MRTKRKIQAAGKVAAKRRRVEAQKALESDAGEIVVVKAERGRPSKISLNELKGVISTTLKRVYADEFNSGLDDLNAREYYAHEIAKGLKYGGWDSDGNLRTSEGGLPMREHEFTKIPLCRECR